MIAVVLAAGALLVVAFKLGTQLVPSLVLIIFQVLLVIVVAASAVALAVLLSMRALTAIDDLRQRHPEVVKEVRKRVPAFAASGTLLAEVVVGTFDRAAEAPPALAVALQAIALLAFWIANEVLLKKVSWRKAGFVVWYATVAYLVLMVATLRHCTLRELGTEILALGSPSLLALSAALTVLVLVPVFLSPEAPT